MKKFKLFMEEISLDHISEEDIAETSMMLEKNKPTSPEKWARAKSAAKSKFAVYPSAYANAWAAKKYKSMGGGWRATKEEVELDEKQKYDQPDDPLQNRADLAKRHGKGTVYKPTYPGQKKGMTSMSAYDISRPYGKPKLPEEVMAEAKHDDDVGEMIKDKLRIIIHNAEKMHDELKDTDDLPEWVKSKITLAQDYVSTAYDYTCGTHELDEEEEELFSLVEEIVEQAAVEYDLDPEQIWENLSDEEFTEFYETAAWQRKAGKNPSGGLNRKGIMSYRREHPGSKLSMAVTTKPSKLKKGGKAAKRRKSFCARMKGMKRRLTSAKTARDPDSRINKSLRKWNC